jgi:hypothetical protein
MLSRINLAFVGALTLLPHLAFAAEITIPSVDIAAPKDTTSLPTVNIEGECRDAQATIDPELRSSAYEACVRDERSAFQQLRQQWAHYSAEARDTCIWPDSEVSYVALQTCLEMQPGGSLAVGVGGTGSDGLNSYSYDILQSPPPTTAPPPPTTASPSSAMASSPPTMGPPSPTTGPPPPTMGPPSPMTASSPPTMGPPSRTMGPSSP